MPNWLIIIITILCVIAIIALLYFIFVLHRISLVAKKTDYLVEDLTYKSEKMNDVVTSVVKVAKYINNAEELLKSNADVISSALDKLDSKNKASKHNKNPNEQVK